MFNLSALSRSVVILRDPPHDSSAFLNKTHHLWLLALSHLTEMDGEDGVRAGALSVHLCAGCCPGQSAEFQTLQQLQDTRNVESI